MQIWVNSMLPFLILMLLSDSSEPDAETTYTPSRALAKARLNRTVGTRSEIF